MSLPVALITGASGGIGRACALALAQAAEPFDLALQYRGNVREAEALAAQLETGGRVRAKLFQADLGQPGAAEKLVAAVAEFGPPVALIHAAGHFAGAPIPFTKVEDFNALLEVHALTAAMLCKAMLRYIRKSDRGRIVLVGSLAGVTGLGNAAAYATAKGALHGLCKSLALEAARWQATVNVVAPGFVETALTATHDAERRAAVIAATPLGRYVRPAEVAAVAAFLCTPQASALTGQTLVVDGGMSLG